MTDTDPTIDSVRNMILSANFVPPPVRNGKNHDPIRATAAASENATKRRTCADCGEKAGDYFQDHRGKFHHRNRESCAEMARVKLSPPDRVSFEL